MRYGMRTLKILFLQNAIQLLFAVLVKQPERKRNAATEKLINGLQKTCHASPGVVCIITTAMMAKARKICIMLFFSFGCLDVGVCISCVLVSAKYPNQTVCNFRCCVQKESGVSISACSSLRSQENLQNEQKQKRNPRFWYNMYPNSVHEGVKPSAHRREWYIPTRSLYSCNVFDSTFEFPRF